VSTKAERRAAREKVAAYHEEQLGRLVERLADAIDLHRAAELNTFDVDELDDQIEWLWSEAIGGAQARLSVLTNDDYPEAIALLGRIEAYKAVAQRLTSVRDLIVNNPSETQWVRVDE
jgi:hypothetical protein